MMLRKVTKGVYETANRSYRIEHNRRNGRWWLVQVASGRTVSSFPSLSHARSAVTNRAYMDRIESPRAAEPVSRPVVDTVIGCVDCGAVDVELLADRCGSCAYDREVRGAAVAQTLVSDVNAINRALIGGTLALGTSGLPLGEEPDFEATMVEVETAELARVDPVLAVELEQSAEKTAQEELESFRFEYGQIRRTCTALTPAAFDRAVKVYLASTLCPQPRHFVEAARHVAESATSEAAHACPRCGGSGQYRTFGRCFRCNGTGRRPAAHASL